jgi:hypothetical protein
MASVDAVLAKELLDLVSANSEWLASEIPGSWRQWAGLSAREAGNWINGEAIGRGEQLEFDNWPPNAH